MMTSSNGNIFRVTGPLCGEFTGPGEFPTQRPVTQSFDVFFDLRLNKWLSKKSWGWWFQTLSHPISRQCNGCRARICWGGATIQHCARRSRNTQRNRIGVTFCPMKAPGLRWGKNNRSLRHYHCVSVPLFKQISIFSFICWFLCACLCVYVCVFLLREKFIYLKQLVSCETISSTGQ